MTPWPADPSGMERSNREAIESLGSVRVCGLMHTQPDALAAAGAELPLDDLLA